MSDQNHAPRFGCPQCGSERIDERNLVPFHYPVTSWTEDGKPADYGERREIEVGTEIEEIPYWCNDCYHTFQRPVRLDVDPDACPQCGGERIDRTEIEETPYWCNDCHQAFWRPVRLGVDPGAEAKERGTL